MKVTPILRIDSNAWDEGFKAGEAHLFFAGFIPSSSPSPNRGVARCPYSAHSIEAYSWLSGFIEGDAKRQGYSYSRGVRAMGGV